ncbi:unnamed protein product [Heligmosomoides polygyrus]|uniref:Cyclin-dependent kinase inhibitor n=1 Tax=Heligmosomoides polygyrus TaxID=6339 RepID=A0A183FHL8_HELPZ|nr:unnamed protein product [Heligmosomoides polygyrus]
MQSSRVSEADAGHSSNSLHCSMHKTKCSFFRKKYRKSVANVRSQSALLRQSSTRNSTTRLAGGLQSHNFSRRVEPIRRPFVFRMSAPCVSNAAASATLRKKLQKLREEKSCETDDDTLKEESHPISVKGECPSTDSEAINPIHRTSTVNIP